MIFSGSVTRLPPLPPAGTPEPSAGAPLISHTPGEGASSLAVHIPLLSVAQEEAGEGTDGQGPGDTHQGLARGCSFPKRQAGLQRVEWGGVSGYQSRLRFDSITQL